MLRFLNQEKSTTVFVILFGMTILTMIGMQVTGNPLVTEAAPAGVVSFELVGTLEGSQKIIDSWQGPTMIYAQLNMGLDFLFLTLYGFTIALACLLISEKLPSKWKQAKRLGVWLAAGVLFAAFLDIVENIALIKLLLGSQNALLPALAKWAAIPKFILVLLALLYVLGGLLPSLKKRN